jgi:hypothetical protein
MVTFFFFGNKIVTLLTTQVVRVFFTSSVNRPGVNEVMKLVIFDNSFVINLYNLLIFRMDVTPEVISLGGST